MVQGRRKLREKRRVEVGGGWWRVHCIGETVGHGGVYKTWGRRDLFP